MSIAEKLTTIAENVPKVYEAGRKSMIDGAKVIRTTEQGAFVVIDDIADVKQDISVRLTSDTITDFSGVPLKVYKDNLFTDDFINGTFDPATGGLMPATNRIRSMNYIEVGVGTYTLYTPNTNHRFVVYMYDTNGNYLEVGSIKSWSNSNKLEFTVDQFCKILFAICVHTGAPISPNDVDWVLLTRSENAEPQIITPNKNGVADGIDYSSTSAIFTTDNGDVTINVTYYKSYWQLDESEYKGGYSVGFEDGWNNSYNYLVDENSFANTKIANKKVITVKDVSEVTHKVKLKISNSGISDLSTVTVYKYGKSIVNRFWGDSMYLTRQGVFWQDCRDGSIYAKGTTPSTNVSFYNYILDMNQELEDGKEYIMFNNHPDIIFFLMTQNNETGEKKTICSVGNGEVRFTVNKSKYTYLNSFLQIWGGVTVDATVTPIIVEAGVREVLKPNKNGVIETDSVFPEMTFVADNNVLMEFEYNKSNSNHQAEDFWNGYQAMGSRTDYRWACINSNFIVDREGKARWNFTPKYDVKVNTGNAMFRCFNNSSGGGIGYEAIYIDLVQHFEDLGVKFDTSGLTDAGTMFYNAQGIKRIPVINLSKCTAANTTANFIGQMARAVTIDGIISSENTVWYSTTFTSNNPLIHCIFSGVIGKNFYISNAIKLDYESLLSIIDCLKDLTGTGTTLTLTLGTTLAAKLTDADKARITGKGWSIA